MTGYHIVEPEVAGGLGSHTLMDRTTHPPVVRRLHYAFDGWLGDVLLETFPVFIITSDAADHLIATEATGMEFDEVEVTTTPQFEELYPDRKLPPFRWLKPVGQPGKADFGTLADGRLVVSDRALTELKKLGFANALIEPFGDT